MWSVLLVLGALVLMAAPAAANGVPVQVFLDHLPFKATWQPAGDGRGVAVVSANDEQVRVMAQSLPAPPAGQVYYAWLERVAGGFLSVGALEHQDDGTASLDQHIDDLPYSENFSWVLVSVEAEGRIGAAPSVDIALAGRLPNAQALPPSGSETPSLLPVTGGNEQSNGLFNLTPLIVLSVVCAAGIYAAIRRQRPVSRWRRSAVMSLRAEPGHWVERTGKRQRRKP